jgi:pimeloyl-ACP methyl ester carboxylesterase
VKVTNGAVDLHVVEDGSADAPPVLLLHGITSSVRTWDWLVPDLADRFRVLRLDFRGHGGSSRTPGDYTSGGYVSDAVAVLDHIGRPAVVVGHSLGGVTTAALTQQRPDLLVGALLEDPPLGPRTSGEPVSLEGNALLDGFRLMREAIPRLQAGGISVDKLAERLAVAPDTTGAGTFGEMLCADALPAMAASMLDVDATVLDSVVSGETPSFLDPDVGFGVPTVVVAADPEKPDSVADPRTARHYADISDDVELVIVAGAGHLIHDEKASRGPFQQALRSFLDRVAPA